MKFKKLCSAGRGEVTQDAPQIQHWLPLLFMMASQRRQLGFYNFCLSSSLYSNSRFAAASINC